MGGKNRLAKPVQTSQKPGLARCIWIHDLQQVLTAQQGPHAGLDIGIQVKIQSKTKYADEGGSISVLHDFGC